MVQWKDTDTRTRAEKPRWERAVDGAIVAWTAVAVTLLAGAMVIGWFRLMA